MWFFFNKVKWHSKTVGNPAPSLLEENEAGIEDPRVNSNTTGRVGDEVFKEGGEAGEEDGPSRRGHSRQDTALPTIFAGKETKRKQLD